MPSSLKPSSTALIGYTGLVGSNLQSQHDFDHCYNSKNIEELRGKDLSLIVCAGISAVKWWANKNPEADWAGIQKLLDVLSTCQAERFVLISTVDVYPAPAGVDESTPLEGLQNHVYGTHRLAAEEFVRKNFPCHNIVRLPGLFGNGLKKNVIFDLIHDNGLSAINPQCSFQYYDLKNLWRDLQIAIDKNISLLNLTSEPILTSTIVERFFPKKQIGETAGPTIHYDMRSRYADLWTGGPSPYQYSAEQTLSALKDFIQGQA